MNSSKKIKNENDTPKAKIELTKEDLQTIEILRKKINDLTSSEKDVKKLAQIISQWLNTKK